MSLCKKHTVASSLTGGLGIGSGEWECGLLFPLGFPGGEGVPDTPATGSLPLISTAIPGGLSTGKTRGLTGERARPDGRLPWGPWTPELQPSRPRWPEPAALGTRLCAVTDAGSPGGSTSQGLPATFLAQSGAVLVPVLDSRSRSASRPAPRRPQAPGGERAAPGPAGRATGCRASQASVDARVPTVNQ